VYVGQASDAWVAVFGPDGEPRPAVGRAGDGPGEFRSAPRFVAWKADTLVAIEQFGAHLFDLDGDEVRRVSFRVRFPSESSVFVAGLALADGSFLGVPRAPGGSRRGQGPDRIGRRRPPLVAEALFLVSPSDPVAFAGAALILLTVAAVANLLPARRAAKLDPMEVLRGE
jgi:hypothetical protein